MTPKSYNKEDQPALPLKPIVYLPRDDFNKRINTLAEQRVEELNKVLAKYRDGKYCRVDDLDSDLNYKTVCNTLILNEKIVTYCKFGTFSLH
jgi:hypothetical protein